MLRTSQTGRLGHKITMKYRVYKAGLLLYKSKPKVVVRVNSSIKAFFNIDTILQPSPESRKGDPAQTVGTQRTTSVITAPVRHQLISSACGPSDFSLCETVSAPSQRTRTQPVSHKPAPSNAEERFVPGL